MNQLKDQLKDQLKNQLKLKGHKYLMDTKKIAACLEKSEGTLTMCADNNIAGSALVSDFTVKIGYSGVNLAVKSTLAGFNEGQFEALLAASDIISVGNNLPAFDEVVSEISGMLPDDNKVRRFFFDFSNSEMDEESMAHTIKGLSYLNGKTPITLCFNNVDMAGGVEAVRETMGLDEIVVHTPHYMAASSASRGSGRFDRVQPVKNEGAAFNGGYIVATMAGLGVSERLYIGNAATIFFAANGRAPSRVELKNLIKTL